MGLAWRLKVDQNRHKVKRQRSNKRPKSPPKGNTICTTDICHTGWSAIFSQDSNLMLAVTARNQQEHLASPGMLLEVCVCLRSHMYTFWGYGHPVRGQCSQILPPSPSSQSPSVAAHVPGDSGGVWTRALHGWREYQSGQDL